MNDMQMKMIATLIETMADGEPKSTAPYDSNLVVGKCYLIRTVTMMYTGRLIRITPTELLLEDAAWIADSGRYSNALKTGELSEVEPYPDRATVFCNGLIDAAEWTHPLPREVK